MTSARIASILLSIAAVSGFPQTGYGLPLIGPELELAPPVYQEGQGASQSTAYGDGIFLSAWGRAGHVVAARIRAQGGAPLDLGGKLLAAGSNGPPVLTVVYLPAINGFLVLYLDGSVPRLTGVLVDPATGEARGTPFLLSSGPDDYGSVVVGSSEILVVSQRSGPRQLYARRFSFDGLPLDSTETVVANMVDGSWSLAFSNGEYLASWTSAGDVFAQRISAVDTSLLGGVVAVAAGPTVERVAATASDGTIFAVTWDQGAGPERNLVGRTLAPGTGALSSTTALASDLSVAGDLRFDGAGTYWFAYCAFNGGTNEPRVRRFGIDLTPIDPAAAPGLALSANPLCENPRADLGQGFLQMTWGTFVPGFYSIRGQRVSQSTAALASPMDDQVSTTEVWQNFPSVAFGGGQYLAAWNEARTGPYGTVPADLYASRVTGAGIALDGSGIFLAQAVGGDHPGPPAVGSDGTSFLVVWHDGSGLQAVRISGSGAVLDSPPLSFAPDGWAPQVAYADGSYLVQWRNGTGSFARRLDPATGALLDNGDFALQQPVYAVGCSTTTCLMVARNLGWRMRMADGFILDSVPLMLGGNLSVSEPSVASDGANFLVAWNYSSSGNGDDLVAQRVDSTGALMDAQPFEVAAAQGRQARPRLTFQGTNYLLSWSDSRTGGNSGGQPPEIYGARISTSGTVLDGAGVGGVLITDTELPDLVAWPALASEGGERALLLYGVLRGASPVPNNRLRARFLSCAADSDCASGHCVDVVCCNTACGGGAPDDCQACSISAGASQSGSCEVLACGLDAGAPDGSSVGGDGGLPDAGASDQGLPADDVGPGSDGSMSAGDLGVLSDGGGGAPDVTGSLADSGATVDGGTTADTGVGEEEGSGCACSSQTSRPSSCPVLGGMLLLALSRRRRPA